MHHNRFSAPLLVSWNTKIETKARHQARYADGARSNLAVVGVLMPAAQSIAASLAWYAHEARDARVLRQPRNWAGIYLCVELYRLLVFRRRVRRIAFVDPFAPMSLSLSRQQHFRFVT